VLGFLPTYVLEEIAELGRRGWTVTLSMQGRNQLWESITGLDLPPGVEWGPEAGASWMHVPVLLLPFAAAAKLGGIFRRRPGRFLSLVFDAIAARSLRHFLCGAELAGRLSSAPPGRIHSHFAWDAASTALWASRLLGVPFSLTVHAADIFVPARPDHVRLLLESARPALTISRFNRSFIAERWGPGLAGDMTVTHLGIDVSRLPRWTPSGGRPVIYCTASGLAEKKGLPVLVEACEILASRRSDWKCVIAGADTDGSLLERYRSLISRRGLRGRVEMRGALRPEELLEETSHASMFVLPCMEAANGDRDGIPVALMEAMGMGMPVISSRVSGIPELVEQDRSGLLIRPGDSRALADFACLLLDDPERAARLGSEARRTVIEGYSVAKYVDGLEAAWAAASSPAEGGGAE